MIQSINTDVRAMGHFNDEVDGEGANGNGGADGEDGGADGGDDDADQTAVVAKVETSAVVAVAAASADADDGGSDDDMPTPVVDQAAVQAKAEVEARAGPVAASVLDAETDDESDDGMPGLVLDQAAVQAKAKAEAAALAQPTEGNAKGAAPSKGAAPAKGATPAKLKAKGRSKEVLAGIAMITSLLAEDGDGDDTHVAAAKYAAARSDAVRGSAGGDGDEEGGSDDDDEYAGMSPEARAAMVTIRELAPQWLHGRMSFEQADSVLRRAYPDLKEDGSYLVWEWENAAPSHYVLSVTYVGTVLFPPQQPAPPSNHRTTAPPSNHRTTCCM
jgi:hypothetical protein